MGIYLNPRNSEFRRAISEDIYIDKTALIDYTNRRLGKLSRCLCVSRPRRFGKSMAADMLTAYYSRGCDSAELFATWPVTITPGRNVICAGGTGGAAGAVMQQQDSTRKELLLKATLKKVDFIGKIHLTI